MIQQSDLQRQMYLNIHSSQYRNLRLGKRLSKLRLPWYFNYEPTVSSFRLRDLQGDWHEFESKALRQENDRRDKEARRANYKELQKDKEKEKRRASSNIAAERDSKRHQSSRVDAPSVTVTAEK